MVILNSRPLQFAGGDRNLAGWRLYSRTATIKRDENGHVITTCRASFISLTHSAVPCHRIAGILNCHELGWWDIFSLHFSITAQHCHRGGLKLSHSYEFISRQASITEVGLVTDNEWWCVMNQDDIIWLSSWHIPDSVELKTLTFKYSTICFISFPPQLTA